MRARTAVCLVALGGLLSFALFWSSALPVALAMPGLADTARVDLADAPAPRLHGTVFDWGRGPMPAGVELVLTGDGWQAPAVTDVFGQYAFRNFGDEIAFLNAFIPPEREDLFLLTSDLPVWIRSDSELVVNIALYPKGVTPDPALHVKISASAAEVSQDENVSYTITVLNSSNQDVSQVVIADLMPEGLSLVEALTSQGTAIQDRGLVWAKIGDLAAGETAMVTIVARVGASVKPGTTILNKTSVYSRESVAVQNEAPIAVLSQATGVLPVTGASAALPVIGVLLAGLLVGARRLRRSVVFGL